MTRWLIKYWGKRQGKMNKLNELIKELCPDGVEYRRLDEIFYTKNGYTPSKSNSNYWNGNTNIPWFRMEDIRKNGNILTDSIQHITQEAIKGELFPKNSIIVATSATIGEHALIKVQSLANQRFTYLILKEKYKYYYDIKFLYYYCYKLDKWCLSHIKQGSFASVDMEMFYAFSFPVPPIEVQHEIVHILDNFTELKTELTTELTTELEARQKQYEYYRNMLLTINNEYSVHWYNLSDIADISTGNSNTNEGLEEGIYPFYVRSSEIKRKNEYEFDETAIITAGDGVGVGKVFHYIEGKYAMHQRAYRIHINKKSVLPKYFYHYMKGTFLKYIKKNAVNSSVTSIRRKMLDEYPVPVPSLEIQNRLVNVLDNFDVICTDLNIGLPAEIEARHKQYEYYRDILLTFIGKGDTILPDQTRPDQTRPDQTRPDQTRGN